MKKFIFLILLMLASQSIYADCLANGNYYPEGSVVGNYVCINSQWVSR